MCSTTEMGELSSAIGHEQAVDLAALSRDELRARVVELRRAQNALDAELTRTVAFIDASGVDDDDAARSSRAWLSAQTRMVPRQAGQFVRHGRWLRELPRTRAAFAAGEIDADVVARIGFLLRHLDPETVRGYEAILLDAARVVTGDSLAVLTQRILDAHEPEASHDNDDTLHARRELSLSQTFGGAWHLSGTLTPDCGALAKTVLDALAQKHGVDDNRTAKQRRADALVDALQATANAGKVPDTGAGKVRPHVLMRVDYGAFVNGHGGEIFNGTLISHEGVRRLLCDAGVTRIVTAGDSRVLDAGRTIRTVTGAQWRALAIRDEGCDFPGCDLPAQHCIAHHLEHWADGGTTDLANLRLLCAGHHRAVHEGGWEAEAVDDTHTLYTAPDGRTFTGQAAVRREIRRLEDTITTGTSPPTDSG